jgi:hypothetical protein
MACPRVRPDGRRRYFLFKLTGACRINMVASASWMFRLPWGTCAAGCPPRGIEKLKDAPGEDNSRQRRIQGAFPPPAFVLLPRRHSLLDRGHSVKRKIEGKLDLHCKKFFRSPVFGSPEGVLSLT